MALIVPGQHLSIKTEFKKGIHPLTEFKKGIIPWNKNKSKIEKICKSCNRKFSRNKSKLRFQPLLFCSKKCQGEYMKGKNNPNWKGKKRKKDRGYVWIYCPNHPTAKTRPYIYEHRLVMEKYLRRYLEPWEIIHHINGKRDDNRIKNLQLCSHTHIGQVAKKMIKEIRRLRCLLKKHDISY